MNGISLAILQILEVCMDHNKVVKEQILHLFFGAAFVVIIGMFAVALDLASSFVKDIGVFCACRASPGFGAILCLSRGNQH